MFRLICGRVNFERVEISLKDLRWGRKHCETTLSAVTIKQWTFLENIVGNLNNDIP